MIYPEESGLEIDTRATIGLRELSEEERAKVYELLTNEEYQEKIAWAIYVGIQNYFTTK